MPGGGNPDYSTLSTWEAASDNDLSGYTGPVVLDCYDSQNHAQNVSVGGASNTSATVYREIRSSASCATPWAGKSGTGANFVFSTGGYSSLIDINENYARLRDFAAKFLFTGDNGPFMTITRQGGTGVKLLNLVCFESDNPNYSARNVGGISLGWNTGATLVHNCIVRDCGGTGFDVQAIAGTDRTALICCTAINNKYGFYAFRYGGYLEAWSCYAGGNASNGFAESNWTAGGWNAADDATADLGGTAGDNYKNSFDLLTSGDLDSDGLATADDLYAAGGAGDNYGRNPYNDYTGSYSDFDDFFKNDASGEAISKVDIRGTARPTPDTADASWNVGASELVNTGYTDPEASGGLVFGGEVVELVLIDYTDPAASGGLVFGGEETSADENHQVDGTASGGLVFGGTASELWQAIPNNAVAVKGGTYRISGALYTLDEGLSYPGLGTIAAIMDCGAAPASAGLYRYDLLSIDAAGTITVTAGTEAATPVMPATPTGEIKLDHVLRYYGQGSIIQADIGKLWKAPTLTTLTVSVTDDELAWGESSTAIAITCRDQYGALYSGGSVINAAITTGNGTIAPASRSGAASSFSFTYTRDGNDPGDVSPVLTFSSPTGAFCTAFIKLLDVSGNLML